VTDWWNAGNRDAVMIARHRATVAELNRQARERMRAAGRLGSEELVLPTGRFAVGDRVLVRRNDPERGVTNGQRATVVAIDSRRLSVTIESRGRTIALGASFLLRRTREGEPPLTLGYAMTCHVAHGMTVDRAFVLADGGLCREWGYTALTRGREANHLYVAFERADARAEYAPTERAELRRSAREQLEAALSRSEAESLALDVGRPLYRGRARGLGR
jgi:ATP-dependent exoDNAse (exonuclease V) alpha subunit